MFDTDASSAVGSGSDPLLQDLNEAQYAAVTHGTGPVLVIAGAGSGKTRTLVYRVAHLVTRGIDPQQILLLTFTRRAAQEMLLRASQLLDASCQKVWGGTFHAVGNLLLRKYGQLLGYPPQFTILDRSDAEGIVNLLKTSLGFGGSGKRFPSKKMIMDLISRSVNRCISLEELISEGYSHLEPYIEEIGVIADNYKVFKKDHGLMDYDDLLTNWQSLLVDHPEVSEMLADRFQYILVDEYQDTNQVQDEIVRLMARKHQNVMAVGDDSQSIYSFRGADFRNIMQFPNRFPGTKIIRLERNYRSTQAILSLANAVIEKAAEKYTKTLFTRIEGGEKPALFAAKDEAEQARFVADRIEQAIQEGEPLDQIAVLFRSGFHSYKLEMELASRQIPFEKRGGMKLTESAHIKDVLSFMRVIHNSADNLSWNRILLFLEKVGPKSAQQVLDWLRAADDPIEALSSYPNAKSWRKGLQQLATMLNEARKYRQPSEIFDVVMGYYQEIFERLYYDDYPRRSKDLEQLGALLAGYEDLATFIADAALDPPEIMQESRAGADSGDNRVVLSTVHSAKGLEWDVVFIIHLAEGKFPSTQSVFQEQLEEERRLFYVSVTRARKQLFLTYPRQAAGPDRRLNFCRISPFLEEIDPGLLTGAEKPGFSFDHPLENYSTSSRSAVLPASSARRTLSGATMQVGMEVRHSFFGQGKVEKIISSRTVEVFFPRHGRKTLHLDYAKLEPVD
ncbi:MAG: ATP-dependent helicase [Deltaproteobacteria bacterium]